MSDVTVTVVKERLLDILRGNQASHTQTFREAIDGYRDKLKEGLNKLLSDLSYGRRIRDDLQRLAFLSEPESHAAEYSRVIRMLEMHQGETVQLSEEQFKNYVEDDWKWSDNFKTVSSSYSSSR